LGQSAHGQAFRRGGSLARAVVFVVLGAVVASSGVFSTGCASNARGGYYYRVQAGENLYRIGLAHGVSAAEIARANDISDVTALRVGQVLWIPPSAGATSTARRGSAGGSTARSSSAERERARREVRAQSDLVFLWPVEGAQMTSRFGRRRRGKHNGIDLGARSGTAIRASEAGKVIHSGWLGDYGRVVIIKHAGHYRTVYAHASRLYVRKGDLVARGERIASVGSTGNATGPHLHFELRKREVPQDPVLYLP